MNKEKLVYQLDNHTTNFDEALEYLLDYINDYRVTAALYYWYPKYPNLIDD